MGMLGWLFIFIIGSLIVSMILNPIYYDEFKERLIGIQENFKTNNPEPERNEDKVKSPILGCADIEQATVLAGASFTTKMKKSTCIGVCKDQGQAYSRNVCEGIALYCYCNK